MPKRGFTFLLFFIVAILLFSWERSYSLEVGGYITDSETGAPIANVDVEILGTAYLTLTDAEGFYYFPNIAEGSYTFMIGHENYQTAIMVSVGIGWICGDVNQDQIINILDIVNIINYKYKGGAAPAVPASADVNSDFEINILDIVRLINFKYKSGVPPVCP